MSGAIRVDKPARVSTASAYVLTNSLPGTRQARQAKRVVVIMPSPMMETRVPYPKSGDRL